MSSRRQGSKPPSPTSTPAQADNGSNGKRNSVTLGPNDRLVGQLFIEGDLRVAGSVEGELEATGDVEITGRVKGAVTAYNRLVVGSAGSLIGGDVHVARLTVEDGATFTGKVSMGRPAAAEASSPIDVAAVATPPIPDAPPLEVVVAAPAEKPKAKRR